MKSVLIRYICFPVTHVVAVLLLVAGVLSGCAHRGSDWVRVKGAGPQIAGGQFAPLYRNCGGRTVGKQCQWAYATATGERVLVSDLVTQLDETLLNMREVQAWPMSEGQHKFPYRFTILSIFPTIVVGYPLTTYSSAHCASGVVLGSCLPSGRFAGNYALATSVAAVPGLVWFSPEHGARLFKVPPHANSVFFMINGESARMKRQGSKWVFSRKN